MKYQLKETRYPFTEDEQAKAQFILECIRKNNESTGCGEPGLSHLQLQAFESFKSAFYIDTKSARRLWDTDPACNISPDGMELICVSVEPMVSSEGPGPRPGGNYS